MFWRARLKLTASYAAALALILLVLGGSAYFVVRRDLDDEIERSILVARADLLTEPALSAVQLGGRRDHNEEEELELEHVLGAVPTDVFFVLTNASGAILSNPRRVDIEHIDFGRLASGASRGDTWGETSGEHTNHRFLTVPVTLDWGEVAYLHVGRSLDARNNQLDTLRQTLLAGGLGGILLSAAGGFVLAGRALVPIRRSVDTQRRFLSDASHELRTPVTTIRANNELLLRHPEQTIEQNLPQLEAIAAETGQMAALVNDLLTLARADEGRVELLKEQFDLSDLLAGVGRDMEALAELRGVDFMIDLREVQVRGDRTRLRQLAVILLDNAMKFTPAGGRVTLRCTRSGRRAELSVSDTGPGIGREHQGRVFDRFYRADAGRARSEGGTGLGLAIARWIAEVHGGRIGLDSAPGKGSTFTVRIPAAG
jgi:signal transduction histidine kinase